jgi:hypothetical protein
VNQQIDADGEIKAGDPLPSRPSATAEAKGGLVVTHIGDDATIFLYPIADCRPRVTDERCLDVERSDVERLARYPMASHAREVAKVHRKQGWGEVARQASL